MRSVPTRTARTLADVLDLVAGGPEGRGHGGHDGHDDGVADDGVGFTIDDDLLASLGLAGMRERASLVDGRLEIISGPGEGTTVVLEVPG